MPTDARHEHTANPLAELRVAIVTTSYPLTADSMSGTFIAELARHLPPQVAAEVIVPCGPAAATGPLPGPRVRCFRYAPRRWQTLAHQPGGLPVALKQGGRGLILVALLIPALAFAAWRAGRRADLIHANWSVTGLIAGLAARLSGTPAITTLRGSDIALAEGSRVFRWVLRRCRATNRRLVTVGTDLAARTARLLGLPPGSVIVIPNGVGAAFFALPLPLPGPVLRLVSVGALVPAKGHGTMLEALARLPPETPVQWTLAGDGPDREVLAARAHALGLGDRVHLLGALPPAAIPELLAEQNIFVTASLAEGRPNALMEAMAAGRAIVASRIPGITELVADEQSALLFDPQDSERLAIQLQRLAADPALLERLGTAARAAAADLTWEGTGRRYAELYAEVLRETKRETKRENRRETKREAKGQCAD